MTITRFAPSPTGFLHVGNLRTALINYLVAKKDNGEFILRLDDTDPVRSKPIYVDQIKRDLEWLGLEWDRVETQSSRIDRYNEAALDLKKQDKLYQAFETSVELELKRKKQLSMGLPPVYDRSALKITTEELKTREGSQTGYWRFLLNLSRTEWQDGILSLISIDTKSVSDPVLIRKDGQFLYTLASVVDDIDMKITHVVRGADHVTNTATQIQIMEALGKVAPSFSHHSLLTGPGGEALSKRLGTLALKDLKLAGIEPMAILSHLSKIGTSNTTDLQTSISDLIHDFDLTKFGSSPTKFDIKNLTPLTAKFLKTLSYGDIKKDLDLFGVEKKIQKTFWSIAKENINCKSDIETWWKICSEGPTPIISEADKEFVALAIKMLPVKPFDENTWSSWTKEVRNKTGRSGKNLYLPLRKALTGKEYGPDMSTFMPLLKNIK
ncbi:MAG: glutamate--tRNA ligase [Rhodobacteraceae bacterium]|nr:glutamate--tRNA ligase [Paracoccaceae bacterium]